MHIGQKKLKFKDKEYDHIMKVFMIENFDESAFVKAPP